MKKTTVFLLAFMSIFLQVQTQTLYTDEKEVIVFYKIEKMGTSTNCEGSTSSDKKINIWKVTLGIENGYSKSIVPRGVGIANISIYPVPIQPYSYEYCNYSYDSNFRPNSKQRHLDQSLYEWPIRTFKVEEIKPGELITNITYLYLYEEQTPKLTNWEFLGYRLKDDFDANDSILADMKTDKNASRPKVIIYRDNQLKEEEKVVQTNTNVSSTEVSIEEKEIEPTVTTTVAKDIQSIPETNTNVSSTEIAIEEEVEPTVTTTVAKDIQSIPETNTNVSSTEIAIEEEVEPTVTTKVKSDIAKDSQSTIEANNNVKITDCPGEKSLEYRKMSDTSSDKEEQKAYSWLALYYSYVCECESGSQDAHQLVAVINNVVDSFMSNTKGKYGKIPKVEKCKPPVEK